MSNYREGRMNALEKNISIARGEALAAHLLASAAIQTALAIIPNREEVLARISAHIGEVLNMSGPGRGDAHDEFNTQMRETACFQAMQSLNAIARMFRNPPARG
jgi:hypothetical protein